MSAHDGLPEPLSAEAGTLQPAGPSDLDLLAARLRSEQADLEAFVEGLAVKLEDAVPGLVEVERVRRGLRGPKRVRRIVIAAGSDRLELRSDGGDRVDARRAHTSGGIVLKSESMDINDWLDLLSHALVREAERNQRTRQALERLLLG